MEKTSKATKSAPRKKSDKKAAADVPQIYQGNMQEVAKRCKLSKVTVSRAFTAPHLVKEETRERVFAAARGIGYTYNALAATLGKATRPFLGIIASHHNDSQFQSVMRSVHSAAADIGLEALLSITEFDQAKELALINRYFEYRAAAIVVFGPTRWLAANVDGITPRPTCPILVLGEKAESEVLHYIGVDTAAASMRMVDYLHDLGHRRIAFICGPHLVSSRSHARLDGFVAGLSKYGLEPEQGSVYATRSGLANNRIDLVDEGRNAVTQFLARENPPTAIIFPSDQHALGGVLALKERGVRVPEDISVVSMSEHSFSSWIDPPLTTLRLPTKALTDTANEFLKNAVNNTGSSLRQCLPAELVERASAARAPC